MSPASRRQGVCLFVPRLLLLLLSVLLLASTDVEAEGRWFSTGRMVEHRYGHSATLLLTGNILVAGGFTADGFHPSAELYDPATGQWRTTGQLDTGRSRHTATLLPDGKVLVAGGVFSGGFRSSAELYDPITENWRPATSLLTIHFGHTATLLPNGKVLVTGGAGTDDKASELYDPDMASWTKTGSLAVGRSEHTATLLSSGKVLVVGGQNGGRSAELYDPATGTWTMTGSLSAARDHHTATLLPNGKVLVAGGQGGGSQLSSAELYDPSTGSWTTTGSLTTSRSTHTATLLPDGNVLVVGGIAVASAELYDPAAGRWTSAGASASTRSDHTATLLPSGAVVMAGGFGAGALTFTELYDPGGGAWTRTGSLTVARISHTATLLASGKVLVAGGADVGVSYPSAELYDPVTGNWTRTGSLVTARDEHTATLLPSGKVLVVGGNSFGAVLSSAELYDPVTATWTTTGSLATARVEHSATLLANGMVLVAGGRNGDNVSSAELYDPSTGTWSTTGPLSNSRRSHTATLLSSGKVLVAGGQGRAERFSAELYDPLTGTWTATGSLATGRTWHTATLLPSGKVLVVGGFASDSLSLAELYDPTTGTWTDTGSLVAARSYPTATLLPSGRVLVIGGLGPIEETASVELFDPATGSWATTGSLTVPRLHQTATLLTNGKVLVAGGSFRSSAELYETRALAGPRPDLTSVSNPLQYGTPSIFTGVALGGFSEAGDGSTNSSAVNYPLFQMRSVESGQVSWLVPDPRANFSDNPMTVIFSNLPSGLDPGWNYVTPVRAGMLGESKLVLLTCGLAITSSPKNTIVAIGRQATFFVAAQGGRHYRWEMNAGTDWLPIGTDQPSYTTEAVTGPDSGTRYRVTVTGACSSATTAEAVLTISDDNDPAAAIVSPNGGEYWLLSTADSPLSTRVVTWSMSDDVRVCRVVVTLLYSTDGGANYMPAPAGGGLPAAFGNGGSCPSPGEATTSLTYTVPPTFPSGRSGALYKIRVVVTDHAGNSTPVESTNPFYIVQANPDSVRTLILWNRSRMVSIQEIGAGRAATLSGKLQELANHPRVQGLVVDIGGVTSVRNLYSAWDADPSNTGKANAVLFGAGGIHEYLRTSLVAAYSGVKYLVIVGDDRIIPMARMQDRTILLPESRYPAGGDLSPSLTTVGQALAAGTYLSDDPLAVLDSIAANRLEDSLYLPDLSVGRLVETPEEIITTVVTYISQDGILDLSLLNPSAGHKVLITGYDFLTGIGKEMRERWKSVLHLSTPDSSTAPVDGSLIGGNWGIGSVSARSEALRIKLSGNGAAHYGIVSLAGHATHYEEGIPGTDPFDIQGLSTADIYGADSCHTSTAGPIDLSGAVIYAVGCHGGLSVPGRCRTDDNHSLDLPQTMLSRGAVAYIANSGYGWGLRFGIGYSARLVQIFTEQMTSRVSPAVGDLVRETKLRYYLETPRYDPYDEKTVMQWTLYGMPMYVVKTGIVATPAQHVAVPRTEETLGAIRVKRLPQSRHGVAALALPPSLTQLSLSFDFTGPGAFEKHDSAGNVMVSPGCQDANGCYYTLNGLVDRGTGSADLPIQPYLIYDSRLSGSSQHGALWQGGTYHEEAGWKPVIAELISNGGNGSNHGSAPRHIRLRPTTPRVLPGLDAPDCRPSDLELNSLTVMAGEAVKNQDSDPVYSIARLYRTIDIEVFYFNNRATPGENCDRAGPALAAGPFGGAYHRVDGSAVSWAISATDPAGVWRMVVVYNWNTVDAQRQGRWLPLELVNDGSGTFRGQVPVGGSARLTYMVQAVDNRGNVTWLDYVSTQLPASGVPLGVPNSIDVDLTSGGRRRATRH